MRLVLLISTILALSACDGGKQAASGSNTNEKFLPVEKAFQFSSQSLGQGKVRLDWKIADGYHLYKNKFQFSLTPESARIANIEIPEGLMLEDKTFGRQEAFKHQVSIKVDVKGASGQSSVKLETKYQGCSEKGLCYPPETREVEIPL